jgi:hypothetical protein
MLVIVPRGVPRTAFSLARLVAIVLALRTGDAPAPPPTTVWGIVERVPAWHGPDVPYRFDVHPFDGGPRVTVTWKGADPALRDGDEVAVAGDRDGDDVIARRVVVEERYSSSSSPVSGSSSARMR